MKQAIWQYRNLYKNLLSLVDGRGTLYDREDGEVLGLPSLKLIHQLPIPTFSFAFFPGYLSVPYIVEVLFLKSENSRGKYTSGTLPAFSP